ncbi:histidine kinase [Tepidibacter aestuarii]|uniref:histidine kinase n=1 Tax=Tepidibacter aestuarii TaxID=2925782 RepID=UPI0020BF0F8A|nr:histidine kinase [Tepidibacter aestuarii]CAH2214615.1 Cupin domain-containing protein [Tepidibacter aestuarii]
MNIKNIQSFEWGQIEWIYEPNPSNSMNIINVGITTIFQNKRQDRHIHYGNEQVIYVLSGKGIQLIEDKISNINSGLIYHIEAGSVHETINTGDEPIKQLVISVPVNYEQNLLQKKSTILTKNTTYQDITKINDEIKNIYETIAEPLKIPISIFDLNGNIIISGRNYPEICTSKCSVDKSIENCCIYKIKNGYESPNHTDLSAFVCPCGLTVFIMPIIFNNEIIGTIKGGHIRTSSCSTQLDNYGYTDSSFSDGLPNSLQTTPKGTLNAIIQQIKKLGVAIENAYILKNKEEESLKSLKDEMLDIKINNHFLFNTLNSIASLAIKENSLKTYESIMNLSKMLKYTSKNRIYFIQLKDEISYLQNYISLQELRFGHKLEVNFYIKTNIENKTIPFNCLQPIIENCFTHGFKNMKKDMKIDIILKLYKNNLIIEINDNGEGLNEEDLNKLKNKINNYEKYEMSGLMMVYSKLQLLYENNCKFEISSSLNKGMSVKISLI